MKLRNLFNNRIGFFVIKIKDWDLSEKAVLKEIFSSVVIVRCECLEFDNKYEYYAFSDLFDEIKDGEKIPEYQVLISNQTINNSFVYKVKFERVG